MELLWALADRAGDVVIEANFRPRSDYQRSRLAGLGGSPVRVHCACPPDWRPPATTPAGRTRST